MGGAVAQLIKAKQFKFNSWAVLRKPEANWLDVKRQKQKDLPLQAKFFARVDQDRLCYGLHVPAPSDAGGKGDWQAMLTWLGKDENDAWLKKQCASNGIYLVDFSGRGFDGRLENREDQWFHAGPDKPLASLSAFLSDAGKSGPLDFRIEKEVEKKAAVEKKQTVAAEMAALFDALMPLYAAMAAGAP